MRCPTLCLIGLTVTTGLGCQLSSHQKETRPLCGEAHVSCGASSDGPCSTGCSAEAGSEGFGLFGKAFCDPRLSEGTAFLPWQYGYNLCLAGSQLSNTVLGGDPDESLSSRFGRAQEDGVMPVRYGLAPVTNVIVGPNHCRHCIEHDECRNKNSGRGSKHQQLSPFAPRKGVCWVVFSLSEKPSVRGANGDNGPPVYLAAPSIKNTQSSLSRGLRINPSSIFSGLISRRLPVRGLNGADTMCSPFLSARFLSEDCILWLGFLNSQAGIPSPPIAQDWHNPTEHFLEDRSSPVRREANASHPLKF